MAYTEEAELIVPADLGTLGMLAEYISSAPAEVLQEKCTAAIGYVLSFLGKRAKRPVLSVGPELKEAMVIRAYCQVLRYIGYPPGEGADTQFAEIEKKNEEWLALVRQGLVEPEFTDSTSDVAEFGPLGGTSLTPDAWAYRQDYARRSGRCCR